MKLKIRTKKGRIITLTLIRETETHYLGDDKFGQPCIIKISDIDECFPMEEVPP